MRPSVLTARATTRPTDLTAIRAPLFGVALTPAERPPRAVELWMLTLRRGSIRRVAPLHARMPRLCPVLRSPYEGSHNDKLGAPIRTGVEPLPPDCLAAGGFDVDALVVGGAALHGCQRAGTSTGSSVSNGRSVHSRHWARNP